MKPRTATVDRFTPDSHTIPCLDCDPNGRVQSGGQHGASLLCACCHGLAWHKPGTAPRCNPTEES